MEYIWIITGLLFCYLFSISDMMKTSWRQNPVQCSVFNVSRSEYEEYEEFEEFGV